MTYGKEQLKYVHIFHSCCLIQTYKVTAYKVLRVEEDVYLVGEYKRQGTKAEGPVPYTFLLPDGSTVLLIPQEQKNSVPRIDGKFCLLSVAQSSCISKSMVSDTKSLALWLTNWKRKLVPGVPRNIGGGDRNHVFLSFTLFLQTVYTILWYKVFLEDTKEICFAFYNSFFKASVYLDFKTVLYKANTNLEVLYRNYELCLRLIYTYLITVTISNNYNI
jgi:hypothetical protein